MTHRFNGVETKVLTLEEVATTTAPSAGKHKIYSKVNNGLWTMDSSGNELSIIDIENSSTGLLTGGIIRVDTPGVSTTFNVSSGTGVVVTLSAPTPATTGVESYTKSEVTWSAFSGVAIDGGIGSRPITYVAINSSGGIEQSGTDWTNAQRRQFISIGVVIHASLTVIEFAAPTAQFAISPGLQVADMARAVGFLNTNGNIMTHTGSGLTIQKSAGTLFALNARYQTTPNDPSTIIASVLDTSISDVFRYSFQDSTSSPATLTDIDPNLFDDGTYPGDLTGISANRWAVTRVFLALDNSLVLAPPQSGDADEYKTADEAISATDTEGFIINPNLIANTVLIGYIAVRGGATDLSLTGDAVFYTAGKFGGAASGGTAGVDLQTAYENSTPPQIVTDSTRGALEVQVGTGVDTDDIIRGRDQSSNITFSVSGIGNVLAGGELKVGENHIEVNHGYTTVAEKHGGLIVNYLPTAITDTVNGDFTAGVAATSNPTVITTGSATFDEVGLPGVGLFIQISDAAESDNNGIFEVLSHVGTTLTIRGVGTDDILAEFTQRQFTTDVSTPAGTITAVNVSVMAAYTNGTWATGKDLHNDIVFNEVVDVASVVNTSITGTGNLDAGSITSNFGNINNGSSSITTTGQISGGDITATGTISATSFQAETPASDEMLVGTTLSGTGALTMGTTGQVTTINGLVTFSSPLKQAITIVPNTGTLSPTLSDLNAVTSFTGAGTLNYTLPDMTTAEDGCTLTFINNSSFAKTITANTDNPDTIDGNDKLVMNDEHDRVTLMYHFAQLRWYII